MSRFWSPVVHTLTPYVPGEQPQIANLIKLNTNENPYGPSPKVLAAIAEANTDLLKRYPDPNSAALKQCIANYHQLSPEQIFVGNGSDEVLAHVFQALLKHDKPLLFPDISYSFYPVYCGLYGIEFRTIALDEAFQIRVEDYSQANGGIIFPNPNAPTGLGLGLEAIRQILQANPASVVVVDEAYIDFGGTSAIPLIAEFPNLLVVHTLSKSRSLAGLRVGFAAGHRDLIDGLERVKNSFNSYPIDRIASAGAIAAYADEVYFQKTRLAVMQSRTQLVTNLTQLGFTVLPSQANFIFARHPKHDAVKLAAALRSRGIIVRHFTSPRIEQFLRITIGTDVECAALHNALVEILAA